MHVFSTEGIYSETSGPAVQSVNFSYYLDEICCKGEKNLNNQTLLCWQQWRRSTYFEQKTPPAGAATVENINGVLEDMLTHQQAHLLASVSCVSFSWCLLVALSVC